MRNKLNNIKISYRNDLFEQLKEKKQRKINNSIDFNQISKDYYNLTEM